MSNTFERSVTIVIDSFLGGLNIGDVLRYYFKNYRGAYSSAYTGVAIFVVKEIRQVVLCEDICVTNVTLSYIVNDWFGCFGDIDLGFKYRYNYSHDFLSDFYKIS